MLALPTRHEAGLLLIDDDADASIVYVARARPRLALDGQGHVRCRLLRWASSQGDQAGLGARLVLEADVRAGPEELAAVDLRGRRPMAMPWLGVALRLEGPRFDPIDMDGGLAADGTATLAADLPGDAAALLAPLMAGETIWPLQLTWRGQVWMRMPASEVSATADRQEVDRRIASLGVARSAVTVRQVTEACARIRIVAGPNAALEASLRAWALDELSAAVAEGGRLQLHANAADVIRWTIELPTTLDELLPAAARAACVQTVVLDAAAAARPRPVAVRVLGAFDPAIERVDLRVALLDGSRSVDLVWAQAAGAGAEPWAQAQQVDLGSHDLCWSMRVKPRGEAPGAWSAMREARGATTILVPLPRREPLRVELLASGLDFGARWRHVEVKLSLARAGQPPIEAALRLDGEHRALVWTSPEPMTVGEPAPQVAATLRFVPRHGAPVEVATSVDGGALIVRDPLDGQRLRWTLLPVGTGWQDVTLAMVDLRHVDGPRESAQTLELRSALDAATWELAVRASAPRSLQWRLHVCHADGRYERGDWQASEDSVVALRLEAPAQREVQVLSLFFAPSKTRPAQLQLMSESGTTVERSLEDATPQTVRLPAGPYRWSLSWPAAEGVPAGSTAPAPGQDVIVLPRLPTP